MKRLTFFFSLFLLVSVGNAQDSLLYLSYDEFLNRVLAYHPASNRADLILDRADQGLRIAKGAFDPKLEGDIQQKVFKDENYYRYVDGGIKIPTRLGGLTFKAGYEMASGINTNPEFSTPADGLLKAGAMLPIGQGLFIDPARARYQQAKINIDAAPIDRQAMLNNLLIDAADVYWDWAEASARVLVLERVTAVSEQRLQFIRETSIAGDMAAIDTLKAGIQLQNRLLSLQQARLELQQVRALLQVYLWQEGRLPWSEETLLSPQRPAARRDFFEVDGSSIDSLITGHPELLIYRYDLAFLDVERRMKTEKLKPKVNLEYNALNQATFVNGGSTLDPRFFMDNYKWGLQVSFPLFLREARGDLGMTRIKIQETRWKQVEKEQEIIAKSRYYTDQLDGLQEQIGLSFENVTSYRRLLAAEEQKFRLGESSVFEINQWESQLIDAELKLLSLQTKYARTEAAYLWALGIFAQR